jgi:hypothetical protein
MATPETNQRFSDTINVPIAIPAWGLLTLIAAAVFTAGVMFNKMDALIETSRKSEDKIAGITEKQILSLAAITSLQQNFQNLEARMSSLERDTTSRKTR